MHDHGETLGVPRKQLHRLVPGVASVHDERQADAARQLDLGDEGAPLNVARRQVAVEVETALPDGDHARASGELLELGEETVVKLRGVVRVQPHGGGDPRRGAPGVALREGDRLTRGGEIDADRHDHDDPGGRRRGERPVGMVEHLDVTVRVDELDRRRRRAGGVGRRRSAARGHGTLALRRQAPRSRRGKSGGPTSTVAASSPSHTARSSSRSSSPCGWPRRRRISTAVSGMTG